MKPYIFALFMAVLMTACGEKEAQKQELSSATDEIPIPSTTAKIESVSRSESHSFGISGLIRRS